MTGAPTAPPLLLDELEDELLELEDELELDDDELLELDDEECPELPPPPQPATNHARATKRTG
jgi:hypothetical protein